MSVVAVIGAQWGDEGKGKIVDLLAERAKAVVRFSGGDNAGHTVINPYGEFRLHLVPSGIFHPGVVCIIGNGVAINPAVLLGEIDDLKKHGVDTSHLFISDRAHIIMPYHILLDGLEEERRGRGALGTTRKGIGPVFADKIARLGIRTCDLLDKEAFQSRLSSVLEFKNAILTKVYDAPPLSLKEIYQQYCHYGESLAPFIRDTGSILQEIMSRRETVLLEGAQGTMLDPDFGTYPYVTSSSPLAAGGSIGSGVSFRQIAHIIGVFKAYTTRVGGGPMPTELKDEIGELIRERAHEYGATTGRPRRCGWFDAVAGRFSIQINGFNSIALTRLDILDTLPSIKICTGYKLDGETLDQFPSNVAILHRCQPVYEELPGWQTSTNNIHDSKQLPSQAHQYIARLEELLSCPVNIISVGAKREQTIMVRQVV
ncbi:MAG TPA: adenylosuccinate synthase [Dehalococcoidia bacterium]|nr:adenylosuccinate synthase [Dehalococcoidia bacterium]